MRMYTCTCMHLSTCMHHIYLYMCMCICICICIWLQPPSHTVAVPITCGCSLHHMRLQCALGFAESGLKTRVCVQGPMGGGVPRVLSGVNKLLTLMDWDAGAGEAHEGLLGDAQRPKPAEGEAAPREGLVCFGAVGAPEVGPADDVVIVLAPQSMVGASIYELLRPMVERCEAQGAAAALQPHAAPCNPTAPQRPAAPCSPTQRRLQPHGTGGCCESAHPQHRRLLRTCAPTHRWLQPCASEMQRCDAATMQRCAGTAVILINPQLQDQLSSSGVMGVRGRSVRHGRFPMPRPSPA